MYAGNIHTLSEKKKGTKAVTGVVPFQKELICTIKVLICTLLLHKGIVHPKITVKSSFTHSGVVIMQYAVLSFLDHKTRNV